MQSKTQGTALLLRVIRPGDTITWGQGAGEPTGLTAALASIASELTGVKVMVGMSISDTFTSDSRLSMRPLGGYGTNRAMTRMNHKGVLAEHMSAIPRLIRDGSLPVDVLLVHVGPADDNGRHSLGPNADHVLAALDVARVVVAEVNTAMPRTFGDTTVGAEQLHHIITTSHDLLELAPAGEPDQASTTVARNVARLIPDEATLQLGVGAIPAAVVRELRGRRDLGIHTGLMTDDLADLIVQGVATSAAKNLDTGIAVASMLMGTRALYDFAADNPQVVLRRLDYTYALPTLAALDRFYAVNSALQVDLTGQVNSEVVAGRYVGALGGQADFLRGAAASPGGRAIVALRAAHGTHSSIVATLDDGTVTTPRSDVDVVVTEWGVAPLRGHSLGERAAAMIAVAHPAHRTRLQQAAGERGLI